jgi:hypothetical protein
MSRLRLPIQRGDGRSRVARKGLARAALPADRRSLKETDLLLLLAGGEQLGDDEVSPLRWFSSDEAREIHEALTAVSDNQLWSRFNAAEMESQQIYPGIWDEPETDLKDEYLEYFHQLKQVVASAVKSNQGLLVTIG